MYKKDIILLKYTETLKNIVYNYKILMAIYVYLLEEYVLWLQLNLI